LLPTTTALDLPGLGAARSFAAPPRWIVPGSPVAGAWTLQAHSRCAAQVQVRARRPGLRLDKKTGSFYLN
jgi:hypothetical protein